MNAPRPPVRGVLAPHIPAEIYRDGDHLIVVQALPQQSAWPARFAALGFVFAVGAGTTGLVVLMLAALDVAAKVAAGIATPAGVSITLAIRSIRSH